MAEIPKRKEPDQEVKRRLFMLSGNQCAFEGCVQPIIDADGVYVATLCHIEAALPKGERFNADMTNEERAAFSNLMLMCERHHRVTDDVDAYPVGRMQDIKRRHEAKFSEGVRRFLTGVEDDTLGYEAKPAVTLAGFTALHGYEPGGLEITTHRTQLATLLNALSRLSRPARQVLAVMVRHGKDDGDSLRISQQHVCDVTGLQQADLLQRVAQLTDFAWVDDDPNYEPDTGAPFVVIRARFLENWPNVLLEVREVLARVGESLDTALVELDFTVLDRKGPR